jgi:hypothetical protein
LSGGLAFDDPPTKRSVKKQKTNTPSPTPQTSHSPNPKNSNLNSPGLFFRGNFFEKDKLNLEMNLF